ncbi:MAG: hypothetical protein KDK70_26470, partial [Myxococcales bacterium]|nr:hypothetical protein [Myxococcales bacterium]
MTPYDIEPEADRAIDELLDAAGEEAESDPSPRPPFGAVLDRARRLDPSLAAPSPSPTDSMRGRLDDAALADALAPFVTAARDEAELDMTVQRHAGSPGLPRVRRSLVRWIVVGGTLAAAAAVVLML